MHKVSELIREIWNEVYAKSSNCTTFSLRYTEMHNSDYGIRYIVEKAIIEGGFFEKFR